MNEKTRTGRIDEVQHTTKGRNERTVEIREEELVGLRQKAAKGRQRRVALRQLHKAHRLTVMERTTALRDLIRYERERASMTAELERSKEQAALRGKTLVISAGQGAEGMLVRVPLESLATTETGAHVAGLYPLELRIEDASTDDRVDGIREVGPG